MTDLPHNKLRFTYKPPYIPIQPLPRQNVPTVYPEEPSLAHLPPSSFLNTFPSFITNFTCSITLMFWSGFSLTAITSA